MSVATEVRERPILMHARSVRGILGGRKTQTRRIVKPQPVEGLYTQAAGRPVSYLGYSGVDARGRMQFTAFGDDYGNVACFAQSAASDLSTIACPYGQPGDLLYVRETWAPFIRGDGGDGYVPLLRFRADEAEIPVPDEHEGWWSARQSDGYHWRPSIHMPKWASRLWLRVTDVRVERVQEVTDGDAIREGVSPDDPLLHKPKSSANVRGDFRDLWDDTNGPGAWERNDWVWALTFERTEAPA